MNRTTMDPPGASACSSALAVNSRKLYPHAPTWLLVAGSAALIGCGGGDGGGAPNGSRSNGAMIAPGTPMMPGATAGAASDAPADFGNSANPAAPARPMPAPTDNMTADGCEVGKFCAPKGPDGDCGSLTLEAEVETIVHPGNVLLVFDTSGSMSDEWNGRRRWEHAGDAIKNALMPLASQLTVGTVFFPRADPNAPCIDPTGIACIFVPLSGTCGVTPITAADQIPFLPGAEFLTKFTTGAAAGGMNTILPYAPIQGGFTPLKEGLQQAQMALASGMRTGVTSVVVITDGDPNCQWDANTARQIVADWKTQGISTYVIGLPGTTGAGDAVLNDLAVTGGTMQYIAPTDAAALEAKLRQIATETVKSGFDSCEIKLNPAAEAPEKLHLIVTEGGMPADVKRDLADDYKWNISPDGTMVTLEGRLCEDATGGRFEAIRFEFGCVDIPPLKPPPPVM
jgi:hypothetical protein